MEQTLSQYSQGAVGAQRKPLTQPEEFPKKGPLGLDSEGQAGEACQEKTAKKNGPSWEIITELSSMAGV